GGAGSAAFLDGAPHLGRALRAGRGRCPDGFFCWVDSNGYDGRPTSMDLSIAAILGVDGVINGAIYALVAIALVLVFAVTRIVFIPQGEYVAFAALTMALFQTGTMPGTVWLLLLMVALVLLMDAWRAWREAWPLARWARLAVRTAALPLVACGLTAWLVPQQPPMLVQALLTLGLVTPMGPLVYRLAYR